MFSSSGFYVSHISQILECFDLWLYSLYIWMLENIVVNIFVWMEGLFGQMQMQIYAGERAGKKWAGSQMWPKNWRRCEPPKKLWKSPKAVPLWIVHLCWSQKSSTYCTLSGAGMGCVCVWKYLARSRPQRNTFSRDQKRQELKSTMQFECFQQFQTFPILIASLKVKIGQKRRKSIKEGENYFWGRLVNPVVSLQRTDSPGLCPVLPTREDQRTSRRRRRGSSRIGRDIYLSKDFFKDRNWWKKF